MRSRRPHLPNFVVTAHRGDLTQAPENTVESFEAAIRSGAHEIELDLQVTRDGELVLMHDQLIDRTTDGHGPVSALTVDQIRKLRIDTRHRVPTFTDVLAAVGDFPLQVELKSPDAAGRLADLLRREPARIDQFMINTGRWDWLAEMRELAPTARLGISIDHGSHAIIDRAASMELDAAFCGWDGLTTDVVDHAHSAGLDIMGWLANTPADIRHAASLGLDGVTTDHLAMALSTAQGHQHL